MNEIEQWLEKIKRLADQSKAFTYGLCGLVLLIGMAFPKFLLWVVAVLGLMTPLSVRAFQYD